jgi:hypothetical protein
VKNLVERQDLSEAQKRAILATNPGRLFAIPVPTNG